MKQEPSDSEAQELHLESHPVIADYFRKLCPDDKPSSPRDWKVRFMYLDLSGDVLPTILP